MSDVGRATLAPRQKSDRGRAIRRAVRGTQALLPFLTPVVVVLGLAAVLTSGFDGFSIGLDQYRAVPIYAFLSPCLLLFQLVLWERHPVGHLLAVLFLGFVASIFAGIYVFAQQTPDIISSPLTYYIANILLFLLFFADAFRRRRSAPGGQSPAARAVLGRAPGGPASHTPSDRVVAFFALSAADCIGFAALAGMLAATFIQFEHRLPALQSVLISNHPNGAISQAPSRFLALKIDDLIRVDGALAFLAALGAVISVVTVFWQMSDERQAPGQAGLILSEALTQVRHALQPLALFFWLGASLVIGHIAQGLSDYFKRLAKAPSVGIGGLFDPRQTQSFKPDELLFFALGILVAVACVIAAAFFTEYDINIVERTMVTFAATGRRLLITLGIFVLGPACVNAIALIFNVTMATPFQLGVPGWIVVALSLGILGGFWVANHLAKKR